MVTRKRSPSLSRDQNRRYDQSEEREEYPQYVPSDSTMPRSPSDYADRRSQREPQFYEEPDHLNYRDSNRRGRRHSKEYLVDDEDVESRDEYERQRREEEYQARYRSDPNLARYPVKPQPYEEQMRIHAEVSRARHERRHSDVSLANAELEDSRISLLRMDRPSRQRSVSERRAAMESQRSYSMERTREAQGQSSYPQRTTNHSPPTPRRSPIPVDRLDTRRADSPRKHHHLDPSSAVRKTKREKMETMLRNDSLSSDQSESVRPPPPRPHKSKKGGKMRQVSLSSSEEELASTPEYTSCDDVEIESESVSEKGKHCPQSRWAVGAGSVRTPERTSGYFYTYSKYFRGVVHMRKILHYKNGVPLYPCIKRPFRKRSLDFFEGFLVLLDGILTQTHSSLKSNISFFLHFFIKVGKCLQ